MIQIAERLMENFRNVKSHLQLLVNPLLAKNKSLGIQAVRNDQGNVIEGALRYGESAEGPGHEPAFAGNSGHCLAWCPCHRDRRSGRMALLKGPGHSTLHPLAAPASKITGTQSGREHLAVHAEQLALKQDLQILQRHRRPLLLRLEPAYQPALEDHVYWTPSLGSWALGSKHW